MFITSPAFLDELRRIARIVAHETDGRVRFVEHIALPAYGGNVILRFSLLDEAVTVAKLDALEAQLYRLLPSGYLVDFMGDVYQKVGLDPASIEQTLINCQRTYADEPVLDGPFKAQIQADAQALLKRCGLPAVTRVWEIQPEREPVLILLGEQSSKIADHPDGGRIVHVLEAREDCCEGLIKAAFAAKRQQISLASVLAAKTQE